MEPHRTLDTLFREFRQGCDAPEVAAVRATLDSPPTAAITGAPGLSTDTLDALAEMLRRTYFREGGYDYLASSEGHEDLRQHQVARYWSTRHAICPWLQRCGDLSAATVIEVGSGTGSSTAAFAQTVGQVDSFEICPISSDAARARLDILGLDNARVHHVDGQRTEDAIRAHVDGGSKAQIFVLFAVLEHMNTDERVSILQLAAEVLAPGGLLVVGETPNRLTWFDRHTAQLPFFHILPDDLAVAYAERSERESFVAGIRAAREASFEAAIHQRIRFGTGVSYHEFEVALGPRIHDHVALTGYEPEIIACQPPTLEEAVLQQYFAERELPVSRAFARDHLYFVIRKP